MQVPRQPADTFETGLVSLFLGAAAKANTMNTSSIIATDCDKAALKNMKRNVQVIKPNCREMSGGLTTSGIL
jgi:methylase of polypeptide subunit release factors